jgi:hypothetical protein
MRNLLIAIIVSFVLILWITGGSPQDFFAILQENNYDFVGWFVASLREDLLDLLYEITGICIKC